MEKRTCVRFKVPGATVSYRTEKVFHPSSDIYEEEFCPVRNLSRGGILFICRKKLKPETKIQLKLSLPGERLPLKLKGIVLRITASPGKNDEYKVGTQFSPYGEKKGQNYLGNLVKIISLEQKFSSEDDTCMDESNTGDFEVDG
jgi:hypothetical protein